MISGRGGMRPWCRFAHSTTATLFFRHRPVVTYGCVALSASRPVVVASAYLISLRSCATRPTDANSAPTPPAASSSSINPPFPPPSHGDGNHNSSGAVVSQGDEGTGDLVRVKRMPLTLIEEVPLPQKILTDIELLMTAWCEEHARQYSIILFALRLLVFVMVFVLAYVFYRTQVSAERTIRGVERMPTDLRIGNVVYFDITEEGLDVGRIVIGLLTEDCPLYCEYFHRRCTGNGGRGESFRGMKLSALVLRQAAVFGDGFQMTHDVEGFHPQYLPTEKLTPLYRGALSSIACGENRESPNFAIHMSSGDYTPQVFGLVIGGYDVLERMNSAGVHWGGNPKREFVIAQCGELCTLDKSHIMPMPWELYKNISLGFDEDKFGEKMDPSVLEQSCLLMDAPAASAVALAPGTSAPVAVRKPWWKIW